MRIHQISLISICGLFIASAAAPFAVASPIVYQVTVNTTSVAGSNGFVYLQFNPAGQTGQQEATATVSGYTGAANVTPANNSTSGNVTVTNGPALTPATMIGFDTGANGSSSTNYFLADQLFTTGITFDVSLDGSEIESPNDQGGGTTFYLSFFNSSDNPNLTSDSDGVVGSLTVNPNGTVTAETYPGPTGGSSVVTFITPPPTPPSTVPEPSSAFLLIGGGMGLWAIARRNRSAKVE